MSKTCVQQEIASQLAQFNTIRNTLLIGTMFGIMHWNLLDSISSPTPVSSHSLHACFLVSNCSCTRHLCAYHMVKQANVCFRFHHSCCWSCNSCFQTTCSLHSAKHPTKLTALQAKGKAGNNIGPSQVVWDGPRVHSGLAAAASL